MANRKSSITAEMKLTGQGKFKSDLGAAEQAASKTVRTIGGLKPVSIGIDGAGTGRQLTMVEEKHRAHRRVMERQTKESALRMAAYEKAGVRIGGSGGRGAAGGRFAGAGMGASNAGMTYNFVQDYIQGGGLRGVANNIPQMMEAITTSPGMRTLLMGTVAAGAVAYAGKAAYDLYQSTGDRSDKNAFKRYGVNSAEARKRQQQREWEQGNSAAAMRGANASERQSRYGGVVESELATKGRQADFVSNERDAQAELRRVRIDAIKDPGQRAAALAEEEKRMMDEKLTGSRTQAIETMRVASAEQAAAEARYKSIRNELDSQTNAAKTQDEILRRIELEKELVGLQTRLNEARSRAEAAGRGLQDIANQEKLIKLQKQAVDERAAAEEKARQESRDADERDGRLEQHREVIQYQRMIKDGKEQITKKEETKNEVRANLAEEMAMSKMSPRRRAKAEEAAAVKSDVKSYMDQGFTKAEAEEMAEDKAELRKPKVPGRIRGAGYGGKSEGRKGLGTATYDGLAGLAAMQPSDDSMATPAGSTERKRIGGAGRDKSKIAEREGNKETAGVAVWQQIVKGLQAVEKAVRDTDASKQERRKPLSTTAR